MVANQNQETWVDELGREYHYVPFQAQKLASFDIDACFDQDVSFLVAEATAAVQKLPMLAQSGLAAVLYRSEAASSSRIEGLDVGPRRILEAEIAGPGDISDVVAARVVTNLRVLREAVAHKGKLTVSLVHRWHKALMQDAPPTVGRGTFRTKQNWIVGDRFGPRNAAFIPPRPKEVGGAMRDLMAFAGRTTVPPMVQSAIVHAQFETIHPYDDGNGRVGRILLLAVLTKRASSPQIPPISRVWYRDVASYIAGLTAWRDGDARTWLRFFCETMIQAANEAQAFHREIATLAETWSETLVASKGSLARRLLEDLASTPILDAGGVSEHYDVSREAARKALRKLEDAGILVERTLSRRTKGRPRKVFAAPDLIALLESQ